MKCPVGNKELGYTFGNTYTEWEYIFKTVSCAPTTLF